jgi:hypothetical protein
VQPGLNSRRDTLTVEILRAIGKIGLAACICVLLPGPKLGADESSANTIDSPLTTAQVVRRMVETNHRRTEALRSYSSVRTYHLELHGILKLYADMEVKMAYQYPGDKSFTILSENGSGYIRNHVLKRLIEAEDEASHQGENRQVAITPENYDFELTGYKHEGKDGYYILKVTPRVNRKYLFKGHIWVDDQEFAIVRIEGQPATSLSWWTTKVNFVYQYKKVGEFWLPALNETVTHVRFFGLSLLTIKYQDYDLANTLKVKSAPPVKLLLSDHTPDMDLTPPAPADE